MSDFLDLQGAKDLNVDAIHISAVANSVDTVTGDAIDEHVNRVGGTDYTLQGFWNALGPVVMPWTSVVGGTLTQPNQAFLHPTDGNYYSWTGAYPVGGYVVAPGTNPTAVAGYVPRTDVVLRSQLPILVTDPGFAGGAKPDGATINDAAFLAAVAAANKTPIYVPKGVFRLSTPYVLPDDSYFYGPGILKFDLAEHRRRGGSSGSVSIPERYTMFYEFASQSDVSVKFNGVAQPITWVTTYTVEAPGSLVTDQVVIEIVNGTLQLGDNPQSIKVGNSFAAGTPSELAITAPDAGGWFGSDCTSMGAKAMMHQKGGVNNSAFGSRALFSVENGHNNCAFGFQALYRTSGDDNTAMGSIAGEWVTTGYSNTLIGGAAGGKVVTGYQNTALGHFAYGESQGGYANVAIGYRAMGNSGGNDPTECVAVGYAAGDFAYGAKNTLVGYRAGCGPNSGTDGTENTFMGFFAGRNQNGADFNVGVGVSALVGLGNGNQNTAVGHSAAASVVSVSGVTAVGYQALTAATVVGTAFGYNALTSLTTGLNNTAFGYQALTSVTTGDGNTAFGNNALRANKGVQNTAVGQLAMDANTSGSFNTSVGFEAARFSNAGNNNSSIGFRAGRETTGNDNTSVGANALTVNTTGAQNTALGSSALKFAQDGGNQTTFNNTTGVGFNASVSGSNQVQLGNSATTTYVYGTVQNRSDERDKTDVRDTELGIEFIMGLRPVDGRWDMREDYTEEYQVQVGIDENDEPVFETHVRKIPKDGSKKRNRLHHWFIAQEVKALCDSLGVEFGGYQDHSVHGGCDVLSLGYDEFIPPMTKAIQQCWQRMDDIERRLDKLDPPEVSS